MHFIKDINLYVTYNLIHEYITIQIEYTATYQMNMFVILKLRLTVNGGIFAVLTPGKLVFSSAKTDQVFPINPQSCKRKACFTAVSIDIPQYETIFQEAIFQETRRKQIKRTSVSIILFNRFLRI